MRHETIVKGSRTLTSWNSPTNAAFFMIEQNIRSLVNTADITRIEEAEQTGSEGPAGYAKATPLVRMIDGFNVTIPSTRLPKMPFFRPQAGKAAIIMDPQPGDKALAVFAKHDSSNVKSGNNETVHPGSFRAYDMADGFLLNGFLGETPEIWLRLDPVSGDISLSTKAANVDVSCRESGDIEIRTGSGNVSVIATDRIRLAAPDIVLDGNVRVTGNHSVEGRSQGRGGGPAVFSTGIVNESGGIVNAGGVSNSGGAVSSNGVTLETHTHTGVLPGGGDTGGPNSGR